MRSCFFEWVTRGNDYLLTHSKYEKSDLLINKVTTFVENNNFGLAWWISKYQSLQYLLAISSLYSIHYHNLYYLLSLQYSMNESFLNSCKLKVKYVKASAGFELLTI